jgi:uncharacterized protein YodC (DUF2158 family)
VPVSLIEKRLISNTGDVECRWYLGARLKKLVSALATSSGICQKKERVKLK